MARRPALPGCPPRRHPPDGRRPAVLAGLILLIGGLFLVREFVLQVDPDRVATVSIGFGILLVLLSFGGAAPDAVPYDAGDATNASVLGAMASRFPPGASVSCFAASAATGPPVASPTRRPPRSRRWPPARSA
jgi:hypothetical protein